MMPTPRDITASCGLSLRFSPADADRVTDVLGEMFSEWEKCRCFDVCTEEGRRVFRPIAREERESEGQAPGSVKI